MENGFREPDAAVPAKPQEQAEIEKLVSETGAAVPAEMRPDTASVAKLGLSTFSTAQDGKPKPNEKEKGLDKAFQKAVEEFVQKDFRDKQEALSKQAEEQRMDAFKANAAIPNAKTPLEGLQKAANAWEKARATIDKVTDHGARGVRDIQIYGELGQAHMRFTYDGSLPPRLLKQVEQAEAAQTELTGAKTPVEKAEKQKNWDKIAKEVRETLEHGEKAHNAFDYTVRRLIELQGPNSPVAAHILAQESNLTRVEDALADRLDALKLSKPKITE